MSYYQKYLKYKNKYLFIKNQLGGTYTLDLQEWNPIENVGKMNCGIFISAIYPKYILKCSPTVSEILDLIKEINVSNKLFPEIINSTIIENKEYITMEKFDGDITSIYFNLFPKKVLENMITRGRINKEEGDKIFNLFLGKFNNNTPNSNQIHFRINQLMHDCVKDPEIYKLYLKFIQDNPTLIGNFNNIIIKETKYRLFIKNIKSVKKEYSTIKETLVKITEFSDISLELYDIFMTELTELWSTYHEIIIKEITKIRLLLYYIYYRYLDTKYDNFGYILSDERIADLDKSRYSNPPMIFDKYLYVYFLDCDMGVYNDDSPDNLQYIIEDLNNGLENFSVNGPNNLTYMNYNKIFEDQIEFLDSLGIKKDSEIFKILQKSYTFDLSKFKYSFTTLEEVEKYIFD